MSNFQVNLFSSQQLQGGGVPRVWSRAMHVHGHRVSTNSQQQPPTDDDHFSTWQLYTDATQTPHPRPPPLSQRQRVITTPPRSRVLWWACLSVCLCVHENISEATRPTFTNFSACYRSSGGVAICYVLPVLWMASLFARNGHMETCRYNEWRQCVVVRRITPAAL